MKKLMFLLLLFPFFAGAQVSDTTYLLTSLPATDPHNVLIECFTGTSCSSVPAADSLMDSIKNAYAPARTNIINYYVNGLPQTIPPAGAAHDFRSSTANTIAGAVYSGISGLPSAGIDRSLDNSLFIPSNWNSAVAVQIPITDSLNLEVSGTYNPGTGNATIIAKVTYTQPVYTLNNLSIAIVEDSITDFQAKPLTIDSSYLFNNIFRAMVTTAPFGDPILYSLPVKEPGRVYQSKYIFATSPSWSINHCKIIAFVNGVSATNSGVFQCAKTKLAGSITTGIEPELLTQTGIYPNPVKDHLYIVSEKKSSYTLFNVTGAIEQKGNIKPGKNTIDLSSVIPGIYMMEIMDNEGQRTIKKIIKE